MRIVLVFLVLMAISIGGLGLLLKNVTRGGGSILAAEPPAQQGQPPAQPPQQLQPQPAPVQAVPAPAAGEAVPFTIHTGETTASVAERLAEQKMVPNALLF